MRLKKSLSAAALALFALNGAHATTVNIDSIDWYAFYVDDFLAPAASPLAWIDYADGSPLTFQFVIPDASVGTLTVVDAVTAGERFTVFANGVSLGTTTLQGSSSVNLGYDYDAALANAAFSRGVYTLAAGSYAITGVMLAAEDGINATQGGLRLEIAPVPEPASVAMLVAGLGLIGAAVRRRQR